MTIRSWLTHALLCSSMVASLVAHGLAADWPQWRGPDRTDVSREKGLLKEWPENGPPLVWLFKDAGFGYSGFSIADGQLFTMGAKGGKEFLLCLDDKQGTELWRVETGNQLENNWGDGPRGTPSIDGQHVYAIGADGDIVCAKRSDGEIVWRKKMQDFGGEVPNWGYTESPLVDGELVICTPGGEQGTVLALNKKTGEKVWQSSDLTDPAHYSSTIVVEHNGIRQYIQLTEKSIAGFNAKTGAMLWRADWPGRTAVIPTPIFRDGYVYVTSGYGVGCNLFRIDENNQVEAVYDDEAKKLMKNHHGGVVLIGDHLYGHSDSVGWVCQEFATGKQMWRERSVLGKGAVTSADGMLYCISEGDGVVALVEATPEGWKEKSRFTLTPQTEIRDPDGRIWTHPVIANGRMYLRDQDLIFCFDVKKK